MTLTADRQPASAPADPGRPVEFWSTTAIFSAMESGDIAVWKRIATALKRDPYGRTARQVEEILRNTPPSGIFPALSEVLDQARRQLELSERTEVARHVQLLIDRSGLGTREFASRIGITAEDLIVYLDGALSPSASLMLRMRRLSDRFVRVKSARSAGST